MRNIKKVEKSRALCDISSANSINSIRVSGAALRLSHARPETRMTGGMRFKRVVAYVPFKTFLSAIEALQHGIPQQIDTSVWPSYSGAIQNQLLNALRFLGLITDSGSPSADLKRLVQDKANRKVHLRKILESAYRRVVDLDLTKISPRQFQDAMRDYGMTGETHKKVVSFFVQAARYAELPMSPLLRRKVRTGSTRGQGRSAVAGDRGPRTEPPGSEPRTKSPEMSKTIQLKSGCRVTVSIEANFLEMETSDRQFVFDLIEKLQKYENRKGAPDRSGLKPKIRVRPS